MKATRTIKSALLALSSIFTLAAFAPALVTAAGTVTMSLSASPTTVTQNSNVVVTINISAGTTVTDGAQAKVTYDSSKLQYLSVDYSGSGYNTDDAQTTSFTAGNIIIARYTSAPPGPSGNIKLASLTFKALASSGNSTLNLDRSNSFVGDHNNNGSDAISTVSGVTVGFQPIPAAAPNPAPSSSTPKAPTTTTTTKANPVPSAPTPATVTPNTSLTPDPGPQPVLPETTSDKVAVVAPKKKNTNVAMLTAIGVVGLAVVAGGILFGKKLFSGAGIAGMTAGSMHNGDMKGESGDEHINEKLDSINTEVPGPDSVIHPSDSSEADHHFDQDDDPGR